MSESAAEPTMPERWIDREAADGPDPVQGPVPDPRRYAKILVCVGIPGTLVGALILTMVFRALWLGGMPSVPAEMGFEGWLLANVGIGYFLFFQWMRFAWGKRLWLAAPGLWRVSALYLLHLALVPTFVFFTARDVDGSSFVSWKAFGVLSALLVLPLSGLVLTSILWRLTPRS